MMCAFSDRLSLEDDIEVPRPNPQDRRGTLIVLTNERTQEIGAMFASGREANERLNSSYSEKELELISNYFRRLVLVWEEELEKLKYRIADISN